MAVYDLYHKVRIAHILACLKVDHLTLVRSVKHLFLHHALAHGSHLRAALRVDDGSYDISAECRTYLQ